jgi:hypothetical protein
VPNNLDLSFSVRELGRNLAACTPANESLQEEVLSALRTQDQASQVSRWATMDTAIIESILAFAHDNDLQPYVGEITHRASVILKERGGPSDLNPRAVAPQLRLMQLWPEPRDRKGYRLLLTEPVRRRVHELAFAYGVPSVQDGKVRCQLCKPSGHAPFHHGDSGKSRE